MPSLAGSFLVAKTILQDPNFNQTVVLVLQHSEAGAFGLVVNRPADVDGTPFPVFSGGPCPMQGLLMLHGHADWESPDEPLTEVADGVFMGDASCVSRVSDPTADDALRFRMFTGYSGWGPDQLEGELACGAWMVVPASGELLFDTPVDELWDRLAPPSIPQFSVN